MEGMTTMSPQMEQDEFFFEQMTTTMTTPTSNSSERFTTELNEDPEVEVSTYYPIQNEDIEAITDLPLEPIKPRYFQVIFLPEEFGLFLND